MQKFNIIVEKKKKGAVLSYLQERGDVEIVDIRTQEAEEPTEHKLDLSLAELEFVLDLFKKRGQREEKGSFGSKLAKMLAGSKEYTCLEYEKVCQKFDYASLIAQAKRLDNDLVKLEIEEKELLEQLEIYKPWENLDLKQEDLETRDTFSVLGTVAGKELDNLKKVANGEINVRKVSQVGSEYYLAITYLKKSQDKFLTALNTAGFNIVTLSLEDTPRTQMSRAGKRLVKVAKEKQKIIKTIQKLSRAEDKVQMVHDYLGNQKEVRDAQNLVQDTVYMTLLSAWATRGTYQALGKVLPHKFSGIYLEKTKKEKDERTPVLIRNQKVIEPFESVTRVYGMPKYSELDPTPYLSVFFAIFFGMCLSDAGYGLILLIISILGVKFLKLSKDFKRLLRLMTYCSVTTMIVGILYGAYFGIQLAELSPSLLRDALLRIQLVDPIKSPLQIMVIALVFGFLQLWFAKVVNFKYLLSRGKKKEAFLGDFIWVLVLGAIVFFLLTRLFFPTLQQAGLYATLGGVGLLVLTQGHKQKNIILKFLTGVLSLYDFVGMLSDLLSYSRLLALGLTTSIIALVVNVIALLFRDMIPYAGVVVMVLVLIGGHLFNIGINILGGFIHSARLQYVEFFPKFLEGGGRSFRPLRKEYKFTRLKSKV